MKYLITTLILVAFSGCVSYDSFLKPAYKASKTVIKKIEVSEKVAKKLQAVDRIATTYDEARDVFIIEYDAGKSSASIFEALEQSSSAGGD